MSFLIPLIPRPINLLASGYKTKKFLLIENKTASKLSFTMTRSLRPNPFLPKNFAYFILDGSTRTRKKASRNCEVTKTL
jgi:hypothetical protein